METTSRSSFHYPYEHGAWWTFFTSMAGGLALGFAWAAPRGALLALALGMAFLFLASDWLADRSHQGRMKRPLGWKGPAFSSLGLALLLFGLFRAGKTRFGLGESLGEGILLWGLVAAGVLRLRLKLPRRSLALMLPSALLLTAPAMILAALAFGHLGGRAIGFWAFWAVFFASGINYVQTWLRGAQMPPWRIYVASLPYLGLAAALAALADYAGLAILLVLCVRITGRLRSRLQERRSLEAELEGGSPPAHLPTDPREIRQLGWEQVLWSLVLGAYWTWSYLP